MCFTVEYSEVPNVDFAEFNNILHKLSIKEIIFNLSTDELNVREYSKKVELMRISTTSN
jgi:hypothetical protein